MLWGGCIGGRRAPADVVPYIKETSCEDLQSERHEIIAAMRKASEWFGHMA